MAQMASGGTNISPWKIKKITAEQSYSTLGDIKTWIDSEIPTSDNIWVLKDSVSSAANYEFIGTMYIFGTNTYHIRRMNNGSVSTAGTNNTTGTEWVDSGETFTIFYQ